MPEIQIRPFARADRDQLTHLVNAHLSAVAPAATVSVQTLLSSLERDPGEFLVDPWVCGRRTLVAEQRQRIVAAAHLLRYTADERVVEHYRDTAEIRWFVSWPAAPFWPDAPAAAEALMAGCLRQLEAWQVQRSYADGSLPGPGVYGVPAQWPHIAELYRRAGFAGGRREDVLITTTARLRAALPASGSDLQLDRTLGVCGTRFSARRHDQRLGYLEVDTNLGEAGRFSRGAGWADVGNLFVEPEHRRQGVASWLLGRATDWLDLGGVGRLLAYTDADPESGSDGEAAFYRARGFEVLTTTTRMLQRA